MLCTARDSKYNNHFACNISIRVVILKELEQEQLWASWEAGELNRQPAEVNFTQAFLFSTFLLCLFFSTFFKLARNMEVLSYQVTNLKLKNTPRLHCKRHKRPRQRVLKLNHQLKYQYQRVAINMSININSLWKKRRWCLKMFWSYFQFENADVDSQCATGPMSGDAHKRSGPTICMAGGQGEVENA